jgi:hypothetical protein
LKNALFVVVKRKAMIKREIRMTGIMKDQVQDRHTHEYIKPYKEITLWTIFLVISKRGNY